MKKFLISENEADRILNMHKKAVESNKKVISEATLKDIQTILIQRGFLPATSASGKPSDDNQLGPNTLAALQKALNPTPAQGTPAQGTPAQGTPAQGTPAQGTPAQGTPAQGTPAQGTPAQGTPAEGTPAQGNPAQAQPQSFNLVPGLIGVGILQDEAEGRTMIVNKVTPLSCGITEVEFKNVGGQQLIYGYYKPSDLNDVAIREREISFRRLGDGVKSTDPCKEYDTDQFGGAGLLKFGTKPNEKPIIEQ